MSTELAHVLERKKENLMSIWRQQVRALPSTKDQNDPTLNDHIPLLIDELVSALRSNSDETIPQALANMSGYSHGLQRLKESYDIEEVVAEYNVLRGCIHDLANENDVVLQGKPFHILNRVLDGAIGLAVQTYATQQALRVKQQRDEHLSFIVHDLRTPLNAISMAANLLDRTPQRSSEKDGDFSNILKMLRGNIGTLTSLVAQILEENINLLTQTGTKVEYRSFELWALVENVVHDLRPMIDNANCKLSNNVPYDVRVYGDASLLGRVFRNLVANAIKYTPNGLIEVGAIYRGDDGAIECWVKDSGAGIPESRLENVFQKLDTDPDRDDGMGLGLAIVETFIKAHNGEVTVESKEGVGTTFHFFLPGAEIG